MTGGIDAPAAWLTAHIQMIREEWPSSVSTPRGRHLRPGRLHRQQGRLRGPQSADRARRAAEPSRRQLLVRHLRAGRRGAAHGGPHSSVGWYPSGLRPRGVAVGLPARDLHRRHPAPLTGRLRRLLRLQPGRRRALSQSPQLAIPTPSPPRSAPTSTCRSSSSRPSPTCWGSATWPPGNLRPPPSGNGRRPAPPMTTPTGCCTPGRTPGTGQPTPGLRLHAEPTEGPDPRDRRLPRAHQRRLAHLRTASGGAAVTDGSSTGRRPGSRPASKWLRRDRTRTSTTPRQRPRRHPHTAGRGADIQPVGPRPARVAAGAGRGPQDVARLGGSCAAFSERRCRSARRRCPSCTRPTRTS